MKRVLVVIPTYNEAGNILPLITQLNKVARTLNNYSVDFLIVDDNSPDGTAGLVGKLQKTNKNIYLSSGEKRGLGKAYIRGFKHGLKLKRYFALVTIDADFSHDPKSIPSLLAALENGADYVIASRYVKNGKTSSDWSPLRLAQSHLANFLAREFVGKSNADIHDLTGGFKAIRRTALEKVPYDSLPAAGYAYIVNLLHEFSQRDFKIVEVPTIFGQRLSGKSKLRLRDMVEFVYITARLNPDSRARRLVRFGLVGLSGAIVNVGVLAVLASLHMMSVLLAAAIAIEVSIVSNFFMNHLYTFRLHRGEHKAKDSLISISNKLLKYNLIALGGAGITFTVFTFAYKVLGLHYILADILGIVLAMSWNYWMSVRVVWKVVDSAD